MAGCLCACASKQRSLKRQQVLGLSKSSSSQSGQDVKVSADTGRYLLMCQRCKVDSRGHARHGRAKQHDSQPAQSLPSRKCCQHASRWSVRSTWPKIMTCPFRLPFSSFPVVENMYCNLLQLPLQRGAAQCQAHIHTHAPCQFLLIQYTFKPSGAAGDEHQFERVACPAQDSCRCIECTAHAPGAPSIDSVAKILDCFGPGAVLA